MPNWCANAVALSPRRCHVCGIIYVNSQAILWGNKLWFFRKALEGWLNAMHRIPSPSTLINSSNMPLGERENMFRAWLLQFSNLFLSFAINPLLPKNQRSLRSRKLSAQVLRSPIHPTCRATVEIPSVADGNWKIKINNPQLVVARNSHSPTAEAFKSINTNDIKNSFWNSIECKNSFQLVNYNWFCNSNRRCEAHMARAMPIKCFNHRIFIFNRRIREMFSFVWFEARDAQRLIFEVHVRMRRCNCSHVPSTKLVSLLLPA